MYSGDETGGLVVDYGSYSSKFGFAGEDNPRIARRTAGPFAKELALNLPELCVGVERSDHPVVMTVPALMPEAQKLEWISQAFENGAPAVFCLRSPVACAFAAGKSSALVVELGASGATVCPVYEGYSLLKATRFSENLGGNALSKQLQATLGSAFAEPSAKQGQAKQQQHREKIDDMKRVCCAVRKNRDAEGVDEGETKYTLPDGKVIELGNKRWQACEFLFENETGLDSLVYESLSVCDPDLRRGFSQEIMVTGGASLVKGLPERLGVELADRLPVAFKPKVQVPGTATERQFAPFVGCSILASLGSFQQLWLSKKEWEEHGEKLALDRFAQ